MTASHPTRARRVAILGSTGSIGLSTLDVVRHLSERLVVTLLAANTNVRQLAAQCHEFQPEYAVVCDAAAYRNIDLSEFPAGVNVISSEALADVIRNDTIDLVVSAIVGAAGLHGTWAAVEAGKTVAIANKESLVVAGSLIAPLAKRTGAMLLPVDSEHSAVAQCLANRSTADVSRVVLTGSGGPFRGKKTDDLDQVGVEEALNHPTWKMGPKISIDSATLMNKALEVIEARWLFDLDPAVIDVIIHPESIVHSFVEYCDGSVLAQLSPPDMRLPIQIALLHPERLPGPARKLDWSTLGKLTFEPPDRMTFPALDLGFEAARRGGSVGAVLNAANEVAVAAFLAGRLPFRDIALCARAVVEHHAYDASPGLTELLAQDSWAREEGERWIQTHRRTTRRP